MALMQQARPVSCSSSTPFSANIQACSAHQHPNIPGLALKNPPKKTHPKKPKKTHLKKPTKNGFFWVFLGFFEFFIFYENNTNFSLSN
jgi:hypothetical protein